MSTKRGAAKSPRSKPRSAKGAKAGPATSARFDAVHQALDDAIVRLFPESERRFEYSMHGWRVPRPRRVESWRGTIDPNFVHIYLAERKNGITLHLWNPYDPAVLRRRKGELSAAGFKVMVGCIQFNRKGDYPLQAVLPLFEGIRREMDKET